MNKIFRKQRLFIITKTFERNFSIITIDHQIFVYFDLLYALFLLKRIMEYLFRFPKHYETAYPMIFFSFLILTEHSYILSSINENFVNRLALNKSLKPFFIKDFKRVSQ